MPGRIYRFAGFELDEPRFELRRGDRAVPLQPKALDLLLYLVRNRDRVVYKDELLAALWPDVVVSDASLSKAVSAARRALGDRSTAPRRIRTVRGRGFRFVAPLEAAEAAETGHAARHRSQAALMPHRTAFVGRRDVLAAIEESYHAAGEGNARLVLLAGEAGMGKTRTAHEAAARAREAGARVLLGWCHEGDGAPPLWPWLHPLRDLVTEDESGRRLVTGLGDGLGDLAALVPGLGARLRVAPRRSPLDPGQARFRLFETIAEVFRRAARDETLVLVLDDFHWADPASLALLGFVTRDLWASRILVLITYRHDDLPAGHALGELCRRPGCVGAVLAGLSRDEVARLVELEVGEPVDDGLTTAIHERTEGNPFFVNELVRALRAQGPLEAAAESLATVPLPAGILEVLRLRLGRLSPACREMLVQCALVGREIDVGLISRLTGLDPPRLLGLLDEARAVRVVAEEPGGHRFTHALVRDALIEGIPSAERARHHRMIAEALEAHLAGDVDLRLAELAHHFCAGAPSGGVERAIHYARCAGERAVRLLAYDEAAAHFARALEVEGLRDARDDRLRCDLLLALGEAQVNAGDATAGRRTLRRAADLARDLAAPEQLARAALAAGGPPFSPEVGVDDPELVALLEEALRSVPAGAVRVRLLVRLATARVGGHAWEEVAGRVKEAVASARDVDDAVTLGHALYCRRWTRIPPGELAGKLADSNEILSLAREHRHRELELAARSCRFLDLMELGRVAEADRELAVYERLVGQVRVPRYRWRACFYRAMRALLEGRFREGEALLFEAHAEERRFMPGDTGLVLGTQVAVLRREQGRSDELEPLVRDLADRFPTLRTWRAALALMHADAGRLDEARDGFDALAEDDFSAVPRDLNWIPGLVVLSETCAALEDAPRARRLYALLRPCAPRTVLVGAGVACWGSLDRFLGLLATTMRDWQAAERHLEAALRMNTRIGAPPAIGWTEHDWARMLASRGRRGDEEAARRHLDHARAIADNAGMARLAERCGALERRLR